MDIETSIMWTVLILFLLWLSKNNCLANPKSWRKYGLVFVAKWAIQLSNCTLLQLLKRIL